MIDFEALKRGSIDIAMSPIDVYTTHLNLCSWLSSVQRTSEPRFENARKFIYRLGDILLDLPESVFDEEARSRMRQIETIAGVVRKATWAKVDISQARKMMTPDRVAEMMNKAERRASESVLINSGECGNRMIRLDESLFPMPDETVRPMLVLVWTSSNLKDRWPIEGETNEHVLIKLDQKKTGDVLAHKSVIWLYSLDEREQAEACFERLLGEIDKP